MVTANFISGTTKYHRSVDERFYLMPCLNTMNLLYMRLRQSVGMVMHGNFTGSSIHAAREYAANANAFTNANVMQSIRRRTDEIRAGFRWRMDQAKNAGISHALLRLRAGPCRGLSNSKR